MFDVKTNENLGKCLFSNMLPISYKDLVALDLDYFEDIERKIAEKNHEYLKMQMNRIIKFANRLYKQKIRGFNQGYLLATVDFQKLEIASQKWELEQYGKHYHRFPMHLI